MQEAPVQTPPVNSGVSKIMRHHHSVTDFFTIISETINHDKTEFSFKLSIKKIHKTPYKEHYQLRS